jgi:hypothetical protein
MAFRTRSLKHRTRSGSQVNRTTRRESETYRRIEVVPARRQERTGLPEHGRVCDRDMWRPPIDAHYALCPLPKLRREAALEAAGVEFTQLGSTGREKLLKIEALFAGAGTAGELGAEAAFSHQYGAGQLVAVGSSHQSQSTAAAT